MPDVTIWVMIAVCIVLLADVLPILAMIYNLWIASNCQFDYLISGYLRQMTDDERTTIAGSHMLDELKAEFEEQNDMLSSKDSQDNPKSNPN